MREFCFAFFLMYFIGAAASFVVFSNMAKDYTYDYYAEGFSQAIVWPYSVVEYGMEN